ncbi:MAG: thiamine diphosphokinase [Ignavibacteria bacterium]|jgi:thiamine pyrophosphokinase
MKRQSKAKACLIVCDGSISKKLIHSFVQSASKRTIIPIISADGASNTLFKLKIKPQYIIGDLDSIKFDVFDHYLELGVEIKQVREQEHNDFEKAIMFAISRKFKKIYVIGFAGKRTDHTLNNFSLLKKYSKKINITYIDDEFEISFARMNEEFEYQKGEVLSIQGMPAAFGVTTYGLKYPLHNETLEFGKREGALNEAIEDHIRIEFKKGDLLIFKKHFGNFLLLNS